MIMASSTTVQLTVGKVDAGVAILLTPDHHLLEFPALLLPSDIEAGSLIDISVTRNHAAEEASDAAFQSLQDTLYATWGHPVSIAPVVSVVDITPTRVHLVWDHGLAHDPTQLHLLVDEHRVHSFPLTPAVPFAAIPIQGEEIVDDLGPGPHLVYLQFATGPDTVLKSNVLAICTVDPAVDPSSIPLPDSPKGTGPVSPPPPSSPLAVDSITAELDQVFSESSLESLELSDNEGSSGLAPMESTSSPLAQEDGEVDISSPKEQWVSTKAKEGSEAADSNDGVDEDQGEGHVQ